MFIPLRCTALISKIEPSQHIIESDPDLQKYGNMIRVNNHEFVSKLNALLCEFGLKYYDFDGKYDIDSYSLYVHSPDIGKFECIDEDVNFTALSVCHIGDYDANYVAKTFCRTFVIDDITFMISFLEEDYIRAKETYMNECFSSVNDALSKSFNANRFTNRFVELFMGRLSNGVSKVCDEEISTLENLIKQIKCYKKLLLAKLESEEEYKILLIYYEGGIKAIGVYMDNLCDYVSYNSWTGREIINDSYKFNGGAGCGRYDGFKICDDCNFVVKTLIKWECTED